MALVDTQVHILTALDGWRLEWDLDRVPAMIIAYNAEGDQMWCLSGELNYRRLKRERVSLMDTLRVRATAHATGS